MQRAPSLSNPLCRAAQAAHSQQPLAVSALRGGFSRGSGQLPVYFQTAPALTPSLPIFRREFAALVLNQGPRSAAKFLCFATSSPFPWRGRLASAARIGKLDTTLRCGRWQVVHAMPGRENFRLKCEAPLRVEWRESLASRIALHGTFGSTLFQNPAGVTLWCPLLRGPVSVAFGDLRPLTAFHHWRT